MLNEFHAKDEFFSKYSFFFNSFVFVAWHVRQENISSGYLLFSIDLLILGNSLVG